MINLYTEATPNGQQIHIMFEETGPKRCIHFVLIGIIVAVLIGSPTDARSAEQILGVKASDPAAAIQLLTAPHTGQKICDIQGSTPIKFFKRANHGPHKFAKVEVLEGVCAGKQGYVPWRSLDPEPREN